MGGLDGWSEAEVEVDTVSTRCFSEAGRFSTTVSLAETHQGYLTDVGQGWVEV